MNEISTEEAIRQRDEALKALKDVLDNYKYNDRKGIGMGPLSRARKLLDIYGMLVEVGKS